MSGGQAGGRHSTSWSLLLRLTLGLLTTATAGGGALIGYRYWKGIEYHSHHTADRHDSQNTVSSRHSHNISAASGASVHTAPDGAGRITGGTIHGTVGSGTTNSTTTLTDSILQTGGSQNVAAHVGSYVRTAGDPMLFRGGQQYGPVAAGEAHITIGSYSFTVTTTHVLIVVSAVAVSGVYILSKLNDHIAARCAKYELDVQTACDRLVREAKEEKTDDICRHSHLADSNDVPVLFTPYQSTSVKLWNLLMPTLLSADTPTMVASQSRMCVLVIGRCQTHQSIALLRECGPRFNFEQWRDALYATYTAFYYCAKRFWHLSRLPLKATPPDYAEIDLTLVLDIIRSMRRMYSDDGSYQLDQMYALLSAVAPIVAASKALPAGAKQRLWTDSFGAFIHVHFTFYPELSLNQSFVSICKLFVTHSQAEIDAPYMESDGSRAMVQKRLPRLRRLLRYSPPAVEGSPSAPVGQADPVLWGHYQDILRVFGLPGEELATVITPPATLA